MIDLRNSQNLDNKSKEIISDAINNFCHNQVPNCLIQGDNETRLTLSKWLNTKYLSNIDSDELFLTLGVLQSIHILISKYNESGNIVLVDNPSNNEVNSLFVEYGLRIKQIKMLNDGPNIEDLEDKLNDIHSTTKQSVVFYYTTPTYHNPTGITFSESKKKELARLCSKYDNLYILSDETTSFMSYKKNQMLKPLASSHYKILSLCDFNYLISPNLKFGWIYQDSKHKTYKEEDGFIFGESGLNNFVIHKIEKSINPIVNCMFNYIIKNNIDELLENYCNKLNSNYQMLIEYLSQFSNIKLNNQSGGNNLLLQIDSINNIKVFYNICNNNLVSVVPINEMDLLNNLSNKIKINIGVYDFEELINGIDRIINSITQFNKINIKIHGHNGKFGSVLKKEILSNQLFNYLGHINKIKTLDDFSNLDPYNSVIIDVTSNTGTYNLIQFLLDQNIKMNLVIGTTNLSKETLDLIEKYSKTSPVVVIENFAKTKSILSNMIKQLNKIKNTDTTWNLNRETNKYELTNGYEKITLSHEISDDKCYIFGCISYILFVLTKTNGLYNKISENDDVKFELVKYRNNTILISEIEKELPLSIQTYIIKKISNTKIDKYVFYRNIGDNFIVDIFTFDGKEIKQLNYCAYTLLGCIDVIQETYDIEDSEDNIVINGEKYLFKVKNTHKMVELPNVEHITHDKNSDEIISSTVTELTNLLVYGISRYEYKNKKYLIVELKDNVLECDILDTVCALINSDQSFTTIFINPFYNKVSNKHSFTIRIFNENSQEIDDNGIYTSVAIEYYMFHFIKNYKEKTCINIKFKNKIDINVEYDKYSFYLCDKI